MMAALYRRFGAIARVLTESLFNIRYIDVSPHRITADRIGSICFARDNRIEATSNFEANEAWHLNIWNVKQFLIKRTGSNHIIDNNLKTKATSVD